MKLLACSFLCMVFAVAWAQPVAAEQPMFVSNGHSLMGAKASHGSFKQQVTEISPMPNHEWRKTQQGWVQVPIEPPPHFLNLPHKRPRVHPFSVASLTLLLCLASMAWASSEWDWERFVGHSK